MQLWHSGAPDETLMFFAFQILPGTLMLSLSYFAAKKDIRFVELHGLILFETQILAVVLFNFAGLFEMDKFYL